MAQQWQLESAAGTCAKTGRKFEEGEEFYTVLFEDEELFRRVDYSLEAWDSPPEGCFCYFKTRVPIREKAKKLLVDNELLINFFLRLEDETEPVRVQFRFVLGLILMRKRLLRYESTQTEDGQETWQMVLVKDQATHRLVNPRLTDDQIDGVSKQLSAILHGDMGKWADDEEEGESPSPKDDEVTDEAS